MISGTICHKCIEAVCDHRPIGLVVMGERENGTQVAVADMRTAFQVALDDSQYIPSHECCYDVEDPMGGLHRCGCVHDHSA